MLFFEKQTEVYESRNAAEWKRCRDALRAAGLRIAAGHTELSPPVGGCGAKIDIRRAAGYDPETYYIRVRAEDAAQARALLEAELSRAIL